MLMLIYGHGTLKTKFNLIAQEPVVNEVVLRVFLLKFCF